LDNLLKYLVAAACLVIIAGGGYFAWTKWQVHAAEDALRKSQLAQAIADADHKRRYDECYEIVYDVMVKMAYQHKDEAAVGGKLAESDKCLVDVPELAHHRDFASSIAWPWMKARLEKVNG